VSIAAQIRLELRDKDVVLIYDGWSDQYGKRSYWGVVARYIDKAVKLIKHRFH